MSDIADFKNDLARGQDGDSLFQKRYPQLIKLDGRSADFEMPDGLLVELKTDFYVSSPNFFMELYSDRDKKTEGGPFQALSKNIAYYVYWFRNAENEEYWFRTGDLVAYLKANYSKYQQREVRNSTWITVGLLVPKNELIQLAILSPLPKAA